jgi:hypothetical protein
VTVYGRYVVRACQDHRKAVLGSCSLAVTRAGFLTLNVGGETIFAEQLNPENPDDAEWLQAASNGSVLVICGDHLVITETKVDAGPAARLGTLVIGYVPVRS